MKKAIKSATVVNWRTTVTGFIVGGALGYAGYVTGRPELIVAGAGAIAQGLCGKDSNVTGGTVPQ